jgi:HEAT repeat protein
LTAVVLSLSLLSACKQDPTHPETWEKRIVEGKSKKEKLHALDELRTRFMSPAMLPVLEKVVATDKSPEVKAAAARMLGEAKDKAGIDALVGAIEMGASDTEAKNLNKEIATSLGEIGDEKGVPALVKLLGTHDNFTVISAIEALGAMKAVSAFDALNQLATDDTIEPFITKKAIIALGDLGDERAVPGLVKAMFKERKGISFYMESSFALYQLGPKAADALLPVLEKKSPELVAWAEKNNIKDVALLAKSAQVLGDLHDTRAEKTLISMLNYQSEFDDIRLIIRMRAADALGRMRSKDAAHVLAPLLVEEEANTRKEYVWALARIGGRDAVAKLLETAGKGSWDAREESMRGVSMVGDERELGAFEKFAKDEEKLFTAECKENPDYRDCKDPAAGLKKHQDAIASHKTRLEAAKECKVDAKCWAKHLDDASEPVRERAAYEVGRGNDASLIGELMKRLREKNLDTRLAIIQAADWLVHENKEAMKAAQGSLTDLGHQLADEKGKTEFVKVNEDLRRLFVKIQRG